MSSWSSMSGVGASAVAFGRRLEKNSVHGAFRPDGGGRRRAVRCLSRRMGARAGPPVGAVGARRDAARRNRRHKPDPRGGLDRCSVRIAPPEAYRAAGVDYNAVLPGTQATLQRRPDGRPYLRADQRPRGAGAFVDVILEITWSTGRLVREYTLLFDPPAARPPPAAPPTAPAMLRAPSAAPRGAAPRRPAPARCAAHRAGAPPAPRATAPRRAPRRRAADAPAPRRAAPAAPRSADEYACAAATRCSASRPHAAPGVSLDQMLVSLYRGNPQAFMDNNMNRLKAGRRAGRAERRHRARRSRPARRARSSRRRAPTSVPTASGWPAACRPAPPKARARQASGKVQAAVKTASRPPPRRRTS